MADFESRVQYDKEGKKLNPLKIDGRNRVVTPKSLPPGCTR